MKYESFSFVLKSRYLNDPILNIYFGWGNGYVVIPDYNLFYNVGYSQLIKTHTGETSPEMIFDVHGGLTYSGDFDNFKDQTDIKMPEYDKTKKYWVFGFDTAHHGDNLSNCPKSYVESETLRLKEQLDNYGEIFYGKLWKKILRERKLKNLK